MIKTISLINKIIIVLFIATLVFVVSLQVFARVLLPSAPSWTEELARFSLLYLVALSAGLSYKKNFFVCVDIIFHIKGLHKNFVFVVRGIIQFIIFISSLIMAVSSLPIIKVGFAQTSPALLLPMYLIFIIVLIIPLGIIAVQGHHLYLYIKSRKISV